MKNSISLAGVFLALAVLTFVGCGSKEYSIAPVSGKITNKGEPMMGVRVVFTPLPNEDNTDPGPWSTAVTDDSGAFELETRYKKKGAAVGKHTVSFEFEDPEDLEGLMGDMEEARGEDGSKEQIAAVRKRLDAYKKRNASRPKIAEDFTLHCEVPKGGMKDANFDLSDSQ